MSLINLLDEDLFLWIEFRDGHPEAFTELMRVHYQDLFSYGTRFTKDEGTVKKAIQDLFLDLWDKRQTAAQSIFLKYYLFKALRVKLTRKIGRSNKAVSWSGLSFESLFNGCSYPDGEIKSEHFWAILVRKMRRMLEGLSRQQQEIVYLRFYIEAEVEDIAEIMSLDRQPVYDLLQDALKRLKKTSGAV